MKSSRGAPGGSLIFPLDAHVNLVVALARVTVPIWDSQAEKLGMSTLVRPV